MHRVCVEVLSTQKKKLENLSKQQEHPLFNVCDTVKLFKIDLQLPRYVLDTSALGPKNPGLDKFNEKDVIDHLLNHLKSNSISSDVITNINVATLKYIRSCSTQRTPIHITMTKRYLKDNGLLSVPFDKGTGIYVMKSDIYAEKLNEIVNLELFVKINPTRKIPKEMCLKEEEHINNALQDLSKEGKIDGKTLKELKPTGRKLPRLYGLAKVHKNNVPLHPVLSMPGSPYHKSQNCTKCYGLVISSSRIKNK